MGFAGAALVLLTLGCGDESPPAGPYDEVKLEADLRFPGMDGAVHMVRDEFGIAHLSAETVADLGFAQGYVTAHDRLPQMDILRRMGAGTLAELFGGLEAEVVESDLEMRMHRMTAIAQEAYAELQASADPIDAEIVDLLDRYADGVNAYHRDLLDGKYEIDPAVLVIFDPERFEAWTPIDSLVLGRFQAYSLSWTADDEIDMTDLYQEALAVFDEAPGPGEAGYDPARYARRGASRDLVRIAPIGRTSTIDGFPEASKKGGSRGVPAPTRAERPRRPHVPRELLKNAHDLFRSGMKLGPKAFTAPEAGSNNWAVGPSLTSGEALLAGDQHLSLPNPTILYPIQLVIPGKLDAVGVTFPGIPGIILGHNEHAAWQATVVRHDVNDVYLEEIFPCTGSAGDCVLFDGEQVALESWDEVIEIGVLGTITETKTVTYERVPHHGPIIPTVEDRDIVPRQGSSALSVRYTGHSLTNEIRATYRLAHAASVDDAFDALEYFGFGGQNWALIDSDGNIGWNTHANVPIRSPASYTWDPVSNPHGVAPFLVMPADGSTEWEGFLDSEHIPHAINPDQGFLVTANSDPVGETFDGNPLNGPEVDGRPLYVGALYASGLRHERITSLIRARTDSGPVSLEDLAAIQADAASTVGSHTQEALATILATLDGTPTSDLAVWLDGLPPTRVDRLRTAGAFLSDWTLATPPAVQGTPTATESADSVATTIFNAWAYFFLERAFGDEYLAVGWDVHDIDDDLTTRAVVAILEAPESLASGLAAETNQPVLCDDMTTEETVESCDLVAVRALDDALTWLESEDGLATADMSAWQWGKLHTLTVEPLFPENSLNLPPPNDPNPELRKGYPRAGDNFGINRADCGFDDLDFAQKQFGPAERFLARVEPGGIVSAKMSLPGGTIYHRDSSHYRDLMDNYYIPNRHFDLPFTTDQIVAAGEERWILRKR